MSDEFAALYRNLRALAELDRELGISFVPRGDAAAADAAPQDLPIPPLPSEGTRAERLQLVATRLAECRRCRLCEGRTQVVPGEGDPEARLLFVGEGPGAEEDRQGRPFVGPAGQLLDRMIVAMGLERAQVYIANIVKCRPPGNRNPESDENERCVAWLDQQIAIIQPTVICTLGNVPLKQLSGNHQRGITRARGTPFTYQGIQAIPTFHPSYLLRNPAAKKQCWEDLQQVMQVLGLSRPES